MRSKVELLNLIEDRRKEIVRYASTIDKSKRKLKSQNIKPEMALVNICKPFSKALHSSRCKLG